MVAFANAVETIAGRDHPGIGRRAPQVFAEIFEHRWMFGGTAAKLLTVSYTPGGKAGGGDVVAQDSPVHDLREEGRLRNEFAHQVRNVLLTFRREGLLVARSAAESDHDNFPFSCGGARPKPAGRTSSVPPRAIPAAVAQKIAAVAGELRRQFARTRRLPQRLARLRLR